MQNTDGTPRSRKKENMSWPKPWRLKGRCETLDDKAWIWNNNYLLTEGEVFTEKPQIATSPYQLVWDFPAMTKRFSLLARNTPVGIMGE